MWLSARREECIKAYQRVLKLTMTKAEQSIPITGSMGQPSTAAAFDEFVRTCIALTCASLCQLCRTVRTPSDFSAKYVYGESALSSKLITKHSFLMSKLT